MKTSPLKRKTRLDSRSELRRSYIKRKAPKAKKVGPSKLPAEPKRTKYGPARDPKYAAYIRRQPCIFPGCKGQSQHCHVGQDGGMGIKGSDYRSCAMCQEHHIECSHRHGHLPGMSPEETRELFKREAQRLFREWIQAGGVPVEPKQKTRPRMAEWESER